MVEIAGVVEAGPDVSRTRTRSHVLLLTVAFLLTLPFVNPLVHGDGVGYYAYARAPLIQHNLRFEEDWRRGNPNFANARTESGGELRPDQYTSTGYVSNLFSVGPAMLWAPYLIVAHAAVLTANQFGATTPADGFSLAYRVAAAAGTATYGFLGLLLSYLLACRYARAGCALLATLGIWTASSLPVYMYFNPFWSHAHSAFIVALFFWFWDRTRSQRTAWQWFLLGLISGLMVNVYFVNGVFLLVPLIESVRAYWGALRTKDRGALFFQFSNNLLFVGTLAVAVLPTFITRRIIFGGALRFGSYSVLPWDWSAPNWSSVLFSSNHGVLAWTPLLGLALLGLCFPPRGAKTLAAYCGVAAVGLYYVISSYPYWHGMASFGNRFFVSLTPVFVLGLAFLLQRAGGLFVSSRRAYWVQAVSLGLFALWNAGLIFQWGAHLIPVRGNISWSEMVRNQLVVVPPRLTRSVHSYLFHRDELMRVIEEEDRRQQKTPTVQER